jgi:RNA polymerase sigma-70 factor, ECF subfamily
MTTKHKTEQRAVFGVAYSDFLAGLNFYAKRKLNNKEKGEDLVQDTFIKTWKYILKGGRIESMKSFLYHVLNNLIVDEYRKRKNMTTSLDALMDDGFEPSVDDTKSLVDFMDGKMAISMIKNLPALYKSIIKMKYVDDLTLKEISVITGKSANSIAVLVHRGIDKLKVLCKASKSN